MPDGRGGDGTPLRVDMDVSKVVHLTPAPHPGHDAGVEVGEEGGRDSPTELRSPFQSTAGGVTTVEAGAVTGDLELSTRVVPEGVYANVRYADADEWYAVEGSPASRADLPGQDHPAIHRHVLELLTSPGRFESGNALPVGLCPDRHSWPSVAVQGRVESGRRSDHAKEKSRMRRFALSATLVAAVFVLGAGTAFAAVLSGTEGRDALKGTGGPDRLLAAGGRDTLDGRGEADVLRGQEGGDTLFDRAGNDVLYGGRGDDTFGGNPGDDAIIGGPGDDLLLDDAGVDRFFGGPGNDRISVPAFGPGPPGLPLEPDRISCGPGNDEVLAHPADRVRPNCERVRRFD